MIALIDYGAGNVCSVHKALMAVGAEVQVTQDAAVVLAAEKVALPGVGAFGDCMASLARLDLLAPIREVVARGTPFLGICVGMQALFDEGTEMRRHAGLGLLPGRENVYGIQFHPEKSQHIGLYILRNFVSRIVL